MSMWIEISCTTCGKYLDGAIYSRGMPTKLKQKAKKSGWKCIEKYNYFFCPDCVVKGGHKL